MKITNTFLSTAKGIAIGIILVAGISYVQAAWAPPAGSPSEANNAPAPINVSADGQYKEGDLKVGDNSSPLVTLDVNTPTDEGTTWTDFLQVWKTSQFLQKATFGSDTNNGRIDVVDGSSFGAARLNVNYGYGVTPVTTQAVNVKGSIVSTGLENEGTGFDVDDRGDEINNVWNAMLCADTDGKIVLCKDLEFPEVEYEPISVTLSKTDLEEAPLISGCEHDLYDFTANISGDDASPTYDWNVTKTAGPGTGTFWDPSEPSGNSPSIKLFRAKSDVRTYSVSVTVTDDEGNTDTASTSVSAQSKDWYQENVLDIDGFTVCPA